GGDRRRPLELRLPSHESRGRLAGHPSVELDRLAGSGVVPAWALARSRCPTTCRWPPGPSNSRRDWPPSERATHANSTTVRIDLPWCIRSNASLMRSRGSLWVINASISIFFSMYQSTIFGTSVRPRAPPKAEPFQTRPVTSPSPDPPTPMTTLTPHPRWQHSSACRINFTLPTHSKL